MSTAPDDEDTIFERLVVLRSSPVITDHELIKVKNAIDLYPHSAQLHCLMIDLLMLNGTDVYQRAIPHAEEVIRTDPDYAEAWESLGFLHDIYADNATSAEFAFRKAISLSAGPDSYSGLARVLAELGRQPEAVAVVLRGMNQYPDSDVLAKRMEEIRNGEWDPL